MNVGIAGIGFMGMIHYHAYQKVRGVRVSAVCTRDRKKLAGDWRGIQGNFGPAGAKMDLSKVAKHRSLDKLLADPAVDLVDLCLPPAMHADAAVAALEAGKHVFCEKPIALSTREAHRMVRAAKTSGKQLLIGHVLPFFPEFAFVHKAVTTGRYGRLLGAHFKRVIADPTWLKDFFNPRTIGGPVIDLHIHDAHFIRLLCGMPQAVFSRGRMRGKMVEFINTQFLFKDDMPLVTATSGVINQQGRPFTQAFEIHLEKATLCYDAGGLGPSPAVPLTVLTHTGKVLHPKLHGGDPIDSFAAEVREVVRSINSGQPSEFLSGEIARDALVLCEKQTQSARQRRMVKI